MFNFRNVNKLLVFLITSMLIVSSCICLLADLSIYDENITFDELTKERYQSKRNLFLKDNFQMNIRTDVKSNEYENIISLDNVTDMKVTDHNFFENMTIILYDEYLNSSDSEDVAIAMRGVSHAIGFFQ